MANGGLGLVFGALGAAALWAGCGGGSQHGTTFSAEDAGGADGAKVSGDGVWPEPTKPVTRGVERTTCQV